MNTYFKDFIVWVLCLFLSCAFSISLAKAQKIYNYGTEVGKPYRGWKFGELDIHHIYTGRGESNFLIFPDGTSMLVDAGDWDPDDYDMMCEALPDTSRRAGEWIARYITRFNPYKSNVDYLMVSHFHSDHIGDPRNDARRTTNREPNYVLSGFPEVGEYIEFKYFIDKAWPNYDSIRLKDDPDFMNYRNFIEWKMNNNEIKPIKFSVGKDDQIILQNDPTLYKDLFRVNNVIANGVLWNIHENTITSLFHLNSNSKSMINNDNINSIGIKIDFGPFDYFTAGDLSGHFLDTDGGVEDIEEITGQAIGEVDVCKANHHGYKDAMPQGFIDHVNAQAYIFPVWDEQHVQSSVLRRIIPEDGDITRPTLFFTNFPNHLRKKYREESWYKSIPSNDGHIVVKVFNNGQKYLIYLLSAENEQYIVNSVYGPFDSR